MKNETLTRVVFVVIFFFFLSLRKIEIIIGSLIVLILFVFVTDKNLKIFFKSIKSVLFFNLGVSLGYVVLALFKNISPWEYLIYINSKVVLMTLFIFYFFSKVSIVRFFAFSEDMSYLLTITLSQIYSYKKTFEDFRMAFVSRVVDLRNKEKQFIKNTFKFFLTKALRDSKERTMAMKARGSFEN